jgi:hypothetical protein
MGVRIRAVASACAVVAAFATGCVVGPTIDDEKAKAAPAGATGNPTDLPGKNPSGGTAPLASAPPGSVPRDAPVPGDHEFDASWVDLGSGTQVTVADVRKDTAAKPEPGLSALVARVKVVNGRDTPFLANGLSVWIADGDGHRPCRLIGPPGGGPPVSVLARGDGQFGYRCTSVGTDVGRVRIEVGLGTKDPVTFGGNVTSTSATGPAEGPTAQPSTRVVPRSTPSGAVTSPPATASGVTTGSTNGRVAP